MRLLALCICYAPFFALIAWPVHWVWYTCTQPGPYEPRFYRQRAYWRFFAWIYGAFVLYVLVINASAAG